MDSSTQKQSSPGDSVILPESASGRGELVVPIYEQELQLKGLWALNEASRHFDEKSAVFAALQKLRAAWRNSTSPTRSSGGWRFSSTACGDSLKTSISW